MFTYIIHIYLYTFMYIYIFWFAYIPNAQRSSKLRTPSYISVGLGTLRSRWQARPSHRAFSVRFRTDLVAFGTWPYQASCLYTPLRLDKRSHEVAWGLMKDKMYYYYVYRIVYYIQSTSSY